MHGIYEIIESFKMRPRYHRVGVDVSPLLHDLVTERDRYKHALIRINEATPNNSNTATAQEMTSHVHAIAATALAVELDR